MSGSEGRELTGDWNRTAVDFPADRCLHELFEARVDGDPEAPAAICEDLSLTYGELNRRSNQLAHHLRALGVGPNRLVGISVERSLEMVVGLMGIAKAGGAYMPLDPSYPPQRLAWMLADARIEVLLTLSHLSEKFPRRGPDPAVRVVCLDSDRHQITRASDANPEAGATPEDLAYVIYTSGSTGHPKGVVLDHRGRVNNFSDFNRRFSVGPGDRLLAVSSLSFDMTAYDVFGILAAGATCVLPESDLEREPGHWAHLIRRHGVTLWHSAPALLEMLVENITDRPELHPRSLRLCLLGGDWIEVSLPDRLRAQAGELQVISLGGATEASMDSTIYEVGRTDPSWNSIPYGKPMANQLAYVLDSRPRPQPAGVAGELHLGGAGVAWGYLGRRGLSAEKFVPNPFSGTPGDRMYRTGDLARFLPDENLELLGRMDYQVKIRGHRIELGEIESAMKQHPAVRQAVVGAIGDRAGERKLVGYVVPALAAGGDDGSSRRWDREQVDEWQAVYDETYGQTPEQHDPTFNVIGWNSSYTGLPIPEEEMREWVETTVDRIRSRSPRRVLEIGCGTGLMLFRVAPHCECYVGTDLSKVGLDTIARQVGEQGPPGGGQTNSLAGVSLRQQMADDFSGIEPRSFDMVVLNSITQLFPSIDYLREVLEGAVESLRSGGTLFVGDNRNLRLGEALHASIQLAQAPASARREQLATRIRQSMEQEEQLLVDPEFFLAFQESHPRISGVLVQLKRGRIHNELTRFRYDVLLEVEGGPPAAAERVTRRWGRAGLDRSSLRGLLGAVLSQRAGGPAELLVTAVPNARLAAEQRNLERIAEIDGPESVDALRTELHRHASGEAADPEEFWSLAEELSYDVHIGYSDSAGDAHFDALFRHREAAGAMPAMPGTAAAAPEGSRRYIAQRLWHCYGNQPLRGKLNLRLPARLRQFLDQRLPPYMVPAHIVLLSALPLSPNGKVDRRQLPEPEHTRPELDAPLVEPRDELEDVLAGIWAEVLGLEQVGVHDVFLELGGHSLLATQIQSRIHELFPVEIRLRHFFGPLTIEQLAERLRSAGKAAGEDVDAAAGMVLQYSDLSVEELEAALGEAPPASTKESLSGD